MKNRIYMVFVLVFVAVISATLLGWINNFTREQVAKNREVKFKRTVLDAFQIPYQEENILEVFAKNVEVSEEREIPYYRCYIEEDGQKKYTGTAVELSGPGFWSPLRVVIALDEDLTTITGFTVAEQQETPGLGGRISEPWFQEQFIGKKVKPTLRIVSNRQGDSPNEVDAVTGATETSKALNKIINNGIEKFSRELGKAK